MRRTVVAALGAAIALGCSSDRLVAPGGLVTRSVGRAADAGGEEFVTTGGAEITFRKSDVTNRLSFVAHHAVPKLVEADGQFEYTGLIGSVKAEPCEKKPCPPPPPFPGTIETEGQIHGTVTCFVLGGKAFMSASVAGVITQASDPKLEGLGVTWDVTDNGEGANGSVDLSSILVVGDPKASCLKPPALDLFPVETGNVQVHPAQ